MPQPTRHWLPGTGRGLKRILEDDDMGCTELPERDAVTSGLKRPPEEGAGGDEPPPARRPRLQALRSLVPWTWRKRVE